MLEHKSCQTTNVIYTIQVSLISKIIKIHHTSFIYSPNLPTTNYSK